MFRESQNTEELTQNLIDAGCSETLITCFLSCYLHGDKTGSLCQLAERRTELLDEIHKEQSCIKFLDEQLYCLRGQSI